MSVLLLSSPSLFDVRRVSVSLSDSLFFRLLSSLPFLFLLLVSCAFCFCCRFGILHRAPLGDLGSLISTMSREKGMTGEAEGERGREHKK